jgi:hypothetical protein
MATARLTTVVERLSFGESYFIYDPDGGQQNFAPNSPEWFSWLAARSSFHFKGKAAHFTARQERKQRGETYWYAYLKAHKVRHKRYLGPTRTLTLAKLEETAEILHEAVLGALADTEFPTPRREQPVPQKLILGSLTFEWNDGLLAVKTPTERHYLSRTQAAELLGYLYDQRRALLNKHRSTDELRNCVEKPSGMDLSPDREREGEETDTLS